MFSYSLNFCLIMMMITDNGDRNNNRRLCIIDLNIGKSKLLIN